MTTYSPPHRSEYDKGVNTFNPEGRIFQVEYAMSAMKLGWSALGMVFNDGIVLACERKLKSKLNKKRKSMNNHWHQLVSHLLD